MADIGNIRKLIDFMRATPDDLFDMDGMWWPSCGTAGCIGGHAADLWPEIRLDPAPTQGWDESLFAEKLGIRESQADWLCYGPKTRDGAPLRLTDVTKPMALAALERLAAGEPRIYFDRADDLELDPAPPKDGTT